MSKIANIRRESCTVPRCIRWTFSAKTFSAKTFLAAGVFFALWLCCIAGVRAQPAQWNSPSAGNPVIPGYFADPTVRKFGDTYYI